MIPSTANVAMPAGSPESLISGTPTTSANTAPAAAASTREKFVPVCTWRRNGNIVGITKSFCSAPSVRIPER